MHILRNVNPAVEIVKKLVYPGMLLLYHYFGFGFVAAVVVVVVVVKLEVHKAGNTIQLKLAVDIKMWTQTQTSIFLVSFLGLLINISEQNTMEDFILNNIT